MRTHKLSKEEVKEILEPESEKVEIEIPVFKIAVEAFLESCCYSALKSVFVLPEGANVFKRFGRFVLCWAASEKASKYVTDTTNELYSDCKQIVLNTKALIEEENKNGSDNN